MKKREKKRERERERDPTLQSLHNTHWGRVLTTNSPATEINCPRPVRRTFFFTIHRNELKYRLATLADVRSAQLTRLRLSKPRLDDRLRTNRTMKWKTGRKIAIYRRRYWPRQVSVIDRKFRRGRWHTADGSFVEKRGDYNRPRFTGSMPSWNIFGVVCGPKVYSRFLP